MSRRSIATLYGVVRLIAGTDCICIAAFREPGMNFDLVAETDADLTITNFSELYPGEGYLVEGLPLNADVKRRHSIGEPSPIPYICDGKAAIVMGDRHPDDIGGVMPTTAQGQLVRSEVQFLLKRARDGTFRKLMERWHVAELEALFPDVFEERPSNTRYWLTRYRLAVTRSKITGASQAVSQSFRRRGTTWLELFGGKTDFNRMKLIFGNVDDGVFGREDFVSSAFAFFTNKLANGEFSFLERLARKEPFFLALFPEGLYFHDLTHINARAPFSFRRPSDFLGELKRRLYSAGGKAKLTKVKDLALVLFGTKDVPSELIDTISSLRSSLSERFHRAVEAANRSSLRQSKQRVLSYDSNDVELATEVVTAYETLAELEAVEYGNARFAPRALDFLSYDREFVDEMRAISKLKPEV